MLRSFGFREVLCAFALSSLQAMAEDGVGSSVGLEEVIVTAQKRAQTLQDVPISISVATAKDIEAINAFQFEDLEQLTPGVSLNPGLQSASIQLRGVGPGFFSVNSPQSVVVFVDQFAQSQIGAVFSTLVDVERLELLRGPQGTLYGINAPGGAYNITTRSPDFAGIGGYVEASYSQFEDSELTAADLRGAINIPLVDNRLALRLAAVRRDDSGFIRNVNPASQDSTNGGGETGALRAKLRWLMNSTMQLDTTVNYQDITQYIASFAYEGQIPGTGAGTGIPAQFNEFVDRKDYGDSIGEVEGKVEDVSVHWSWEAGPVDVDFLAMHQEFSNQSVENRAPYPGSEEIFDIDLDFEITTLELRFSNSMEYLDYVAGAYYFDRPAHGKFNVVVSGTEVIGDSVGVDEGYAAFGNVSLNLAEKWVLGLGARYDDINVSMNGDTSFLTYEAPIDDELDFDHLSWSIKLSYQVAENLTAYAALDNAFKQGGFNALVPGVFSLEDIFPDIAAVAHDVAVFDEEISDSFEIGIKGIALDNRLRFNAALFYQKFEDHQMAFPGNVEALQPLSGLFENQLGNADEVVTSGIEFDVTYILSENWETALRAAYSDPVIKEWEGRFCPPGEEPPLLPGQSPIPDQLYCPVEDEPLNSLPRWQTNFQLGYDRPLTALWSFSARLNWTWQSKPARQALAESTDPSAPDVSRFDEAKSRVDLSASLRDDSFGVEMKLWVKNITNEDMNIDPERFEDSQTLKGSHFPGRQYGLTARYLF